MYKRADNEELLAKVVAELGATAAVEVNPFYQELFESIVIDRAYQLKKWGDEFDAKNNPNDWTIEHIIPLPVPTDMNTFIEQSHIDNLQPLCPTCNASKTAKDRFTHKKDRHTPPHINPT